MRYWKSMDFLPVRSHRLHLSVCVYCIWVCVLIHFILIVPLFIFYIKFTEKNVLLRHTFVSFLGRIDWLIWENGRADIAKRILSTVDGRQDTWRVCCFSLFIEPKYEAIDYLKFTNAIITFELGFRFLSRVRELVRTHSPCRLLLSRWYCLLSICAEILFYS